MFAASRFGMISTLASPLRREPGSTLSRIACDRAVSAAISPSTSRSGARSRRSARAWRILRDEAVSNEPKSAWLTSAIFGDRPKRRAVSPQAMATSAISSALGSGRTWVSARK